MYKNLLDAQKNSAGQNEEQFRYLRDELESMRDQLEATNALKNILFAELE